MTVPQLLIIGRKSIDPMNGRAMWLGRCPECSFEIVVAQSRIGGKPIDCAACAAWEADHLTRFPAL